MRLGALRYVGLAACIGASGVAGACLNGTFACESDLQCPDGRCEPQGWCSFPDGSCVSGHRFGSHAGDGLADLCTEEGAATTAETSTSASTSNTTPGDASDASDTTAGVACGNGRIEGDEECDDGNEVDGDGCNRDCVASGSVRWSLSHAGAAAADDRIGSIIIRSTDIVAVGREGVGGDEDRGLFLVALLDGTLDDVIVESGPNDGYERPIGAVGIDDDEIVAVGRQHDAADNEVAWIARYDSDLDPVWSVQGEPGVFNDVAYDGRSLLAVAGRAGATPTRVGMLAIWDLDGVDLEVVTDEIDPSRARDVTFAGGVPFVAATQGDWTTLCGGFNGIVGSTSSSILPAYEIEAPNGNCSDAQAITADGSDLIVAGFRTLGSGENRNGVVARLDSAQSETWIDVYDASEQSEEFEGVTVAPNGDIVAVGLSGNDAGDDFDFVARRYTATGDVRWTRTWGSTPLDVLRAVAFTDEGNIVVGGETEEEPGEIDAYVACIAP